MQKSGWLLYGATGYTGRLMVKLAVSKGMKPILAGRTEASLKELAESFGLSYLAFSLDSVDEVAEKVSPFQIVMNCAGPFIRTAENMVKACIKAKTHYLDITGEIEVFERVKSFDVQAKDAGIILMSGTGFDVVPTDCAAAYLHQKLPDATHLQLAFTSIGGSISHGTMQTMVENLGSSGAVRENGKIVPKPTGHKSMTVDFGRKKRFCMTIPWGDVSTAHHTTGIPNIETYTAVSKSSHTFMKFQGIFNPIMRTTWVKNRVKAYVTKNITGPTEEQNQTGRSLVWGKAWNAAGQSEEVRIEGPEGYKLTAETSVYIVFELLKGTDKKGYQTPAGMFGYKLILQIDETQLY